jgi:phosphoenolpyruvate phosphomutase
VKGIILASGVGERLQPHTNDKPKSLLKITDKTIIEHQLDILKKCKIKDVVIPTGPFEELLQKFLREKYQDFNFSFVPNPQYDTTNYIYSLWLTKDHIDDDIILFHGDLIFTEKLLKKMLETPGNLVSVNKKIKPPEKDFKALIEKDKVTKIGVGYKGKNAYFSLPLYKFNKKDFLKWIYEIEKEIKDGKLEVYAEEAFNKISDDVNLKPLYYEDKTCMEIDTVDDLKTAKQKLKG